MKPPTPPNQEIRSSTEKITMDIVWVEHKGKKYKAPINILSIAIMEYIEPSVEEELKVYTKSLWNLLGL